MSSLVRSLAEAHRSTALSIQDFLWEGRPHHSPRIERTKEEHEEFLESLRADAWEQYNDASNELGWGI